ncbi:DUF3515 family protein [Streptomyces sp. NPDC005728]|uniref:DUF3515 family protein n=1 Tax=Streptomyces sp. NPDC005728 TaxID=3157054 RepID=UPI0033F4F79D
MGKKTVTVPSSRRTRLVIGVGVCVLASAAAVTAYAFQHRDPGVPAAKNSDAPQCRRITDAAPDSLGGLSRWDSDASGVAVWGDRAIVLRCGVTPPGLTHDPCFAVDGVDWVIDTKQSTHTRKVIVTYGRTPATQVVFDGGGRTDAALVELSRLVAPIRQASHCLDSA